MKDESEYKERGQQAWSISSAATYSVQRSPIFFDLKLCADPSPKKKSCLNGNAENQFHTHAHTHARTCTHTSERIKSFDFDCIHLLYSSVSLGFVCLTSVSCPFEWSTISIRWTKACEWILQAAWLHISLYPLKYLVASSSLHPIFCVFCLVCWTWLDWTCALFSHCDRHNCHCEPLVHQLHH